MNHALSYPCFMKYSENKNCSTQHALLLVIEKWRESVYNRNSLGAILTDLSFIVFLVILK